MLRLERESDYDAIYDVNMMAFGRPAEAELVNLLRVAAVSPFISVVAFRDDRLVGHILFIPVRVEGGEPFTALALGPMAVLPKFQRSGIGSELVRFGLDVCRREGHEIVFVVGHPNFYPRFGCVPAQPLGLTWDRPVPTDVFMVIELTPGALRARSGIVRYRPEFDQV
jgi:putative acetyltransferase